YSSQNANFEFLGDLNPYGLRYLTGDEGTNLIRQINVTDNVSYLIGNHQMKFGLDYRRIGPELDPFAYEQAALFQSLSAVIANVATLMAVVARQQDEELAFNNWSLFAQDTWKAARTLALTYGVRWEYNAAPTSPNGTLPYTVEGLNNFQTMTLAPKNTP